MGPVSYAECCSHWRISRGDYAHGSTPHIGLVCRGLGCQLLDIHDKGISFLCLHLRQYTSHQRPWSSDRNQEKETTVGTINISVIYITKFKFRLVVRWLLGLHLTPNFHDCWQIVIMVRTCTVSDLIYLMLDPKAQHEASTEKVAKRCAVALSLVVLT